MQSQTNPQTPIAIYQSADGSIATEVRLKVSLSPIQYVQNLHILPLMGRLPKSITLIWMSSSPLLALPYSMLCH